MFSTIYKLVQSKRKIETSLFTSFLRLQFQFIGKNCSIHPTVSYKNPDKIYVSDNCIIKEGVILDGRTNKDTGIYVGKNVTIRAYTYIDCYGFDGYVYLDDYSSIGQHVIIGGNGGVHIGKFVMISGLTYIVSASRVYDVSDSVPYNYQGEIRKPVIIEDNAWIASHSMILSGVRIGENSIVGAGSVVTKDVPPNTLVIGSPAKIQRSLSPNDQRRYNDEDIFYYLSKEERDKMAEIRKLYQNLKD